MRPRPADFKQSLINLLLRGWKLYATPPTSHSLSFEGVKPMQACHKQFHKMLGICMNTLSYCFCFIGFGCLQERHVWGGWVQGHRGAWYSFRAPSPHSTRPGDILFSLFYYLYCISPDFSDPPDMTDGYMNMTVINE